MVLFVMIKSKQYAHIHTHTLSSLCQCKCVRMQEVQHKHKYNMYEWKIWRGSPHFVLEFLYTKARLINNFTVI